MDPARKGLGLFSAAGSAMPMMGIAADSTPAVFPNRPIRLVVGFAAGGGSDTIARHLALAMTAELGQRVIIENRPGAAGNFGAAGVAKATPDGYTLLLATGPVAMGPVAMGGTPYKDMCYDFLRDLVPVGLVAYVPFVLVVGKHVGVSTFKEALSITRSEVRRFSCGFAGLGSFPHLLYEQLSQKTGISWINVPYHGAAPALLDVAAGTTDFSLVSVAAAVPFVYSGAVRALAVFSDAEVIALASVPTIGRYGLRDVQGSGWYAIVAPAGTPSSAITHLNGAVNAAVSSLSVRETLLETGYLLPPSNSTPQFIEDFLSDDSKKWTAMMEARWSNGIK